MVGNRQDKVSEILKRELSQIFQREARTICKGAMVSVTIVRVTADLSLAKVYISIFGNPDKQAVFDNVEKCASYIRGMLAKTVGKSMRKVPELAFYLDDSLDYSEEIDKLLKR